jgi:hypothetical protein
MLGEQGSAYTYVSHTCSVGHVISPDPSVSESSIMEQAWQGLLSTVPPRACRANTTN